MTAEQRSKEPTETPEGSTLLSPSRRRLVRGAAGSAGVLLSVHAKTALGGTCQSPSAQISNNASPRPGNTTICSGGRSPGFWKQPQKKANWPAAGAEFPTFNVTVSECAAGQQNLTLTTIVTPGTLFSSVFGDNPMVAPGVTRPAGLGIGIWEVLAFPNNFNVGQLARHLSAAWLNAGLFNSSTGQYPVTRLQIIAMWNATKNGGTYCPSSIVSCALPWSAGMVIDYISGMYDINASGIVEPDLCKPNT